ncbi:MAG: MDR family MFS transporter [Candidatus Saccharimonadales bacterium]
MMHHISNQQKTIVMAAVMSALFLVALDQTIIATALGRIVEEFNSFSSLTWIITAYLLTTTVTIPIAGKMSDIFGRRKVLLSGVVIFVLGSLWSGSAGSIDQLIFARAFQGIGGGIIMANAFTVVGDLFSPRERGKWQGLIGAVFGLSSVVGPLLGGFLTDPHTIGTLTTNWRWTFWINVPIGIISFFIIAKYMPQIRHDHKSKIDVLGASLLTIALSSLILAVDNTEKIFASVVDAGVDLRAIQAALYVLVIVAAVGFILAERRAKEPIIPLQFFKKWNFSLLMAISLLFGAAFLGAILYLTQFNQQVFGANATESGLMLLPMVFGLTVSAALTGQLVSRTGVYKLPLVIGFTVATLAVFALTTLHPESPYMQEAIIMFFAGVGLGIGMPIINLAVQNEFTQRDLGSATASAQLFRGLGSTVGTAVLGTMLISGVTSQLGVIKQDPYIELLRQQPTAQPMLQEITTDTVLNLNTSDAKNQINEGVTSGLVSLPEQARQQVQANFTQKQTTFTDRVVTSFSDSLRYVFITSGILLASATALVLFVKEKPLRGGPDDTPGVA